MVPKALPKKIKSTGKATPKKQEWQAVPKKQEGEAMPFSSKNDDEPAKPTTTKRSVTLLKESNTPVFRYILMSRRKNGQSHSKLDQAKPTHSCTRTMCRLCLIQFSKPLQGLVKLLLEGAEPSSLPTNRTEEGFDPNAYKLMSNAGMISPSLQILGRRM